MNRQEIVKAEIRRLYDVMDEITKQRETLIERLTDGLTPDEHVALRLLTHLYGKYYYGEDD